MSQMHKAIRELLPDYLSGALDAAERGRIESHLADCADCSRELADWRALSGALGLDVQARAETVPVWRAPELPLGPPPTSLGGPGRNQGLPSSGARSRAAVLLLGLLLIFALLGQTGRLGRLGRLGELDRGAGSGFWLDFGGRGENGASGREPASSEAASGSERERDADAGADSDADSNADSDAFIDSQAGALASPVLRAATRVARVGGLAIPGIGPSRSLLEDATTGPARLAQAGRATATSPRWAGPPLLATFGSVQATLIPSRTPTPSSNPNIPPGDPPGDDPPDRPRATKVPASSTVPATATATSPSATQTPSPPATAQPVTGRVSGQVRGPDGLPRAEIAVIADRVDAPAEPVLAVTGIDGAYALELDPGRWILHAETPAYQLMWHGGKANPRSANPIDIQVGSALTADFYLESNPPARIRGRVTDAEGRPLARALVLAAYPPDQPGDSPRLVWSSFSDASGDYQLYLPPGAWFLAAAADWRTESLSWWGGAGSLEEADQLGLDVDSNAQADFTLGP